MQTDEMSLEDQVFSMLPGFENYISRERQSVEDNVPTSFEQQRNNAQRRPPSLYVVIPEPDNFDLSSPQNLAFNHEIPQNEGHTPPPSYQDVLKADDLFDLSNPPPSYVDTTASPPAYPHRHHHIPRQTPGHSGNNVDTRGQNQTDSTDTLSGLPSWLEIGIPVVSVNTSIALCIMNCCLPGIGPIIAGFMVLCCGKTIPSGDPGRCRLFFVNILIGLGQLLLTPVLLMGMVWAAMWGAACANIADAVKKNQDLQLRLSRLR